MTEEIEWAPPYPGDLEDLLKSAFSAGAGWQSQSSMKGEDLANWELYKKRPVPISTHQRVEHALEKAIAGITDEMVERAAKALEKKDKQDTYGWSDELFEIWWNKDPDFIERKHVWPYFEGTAKELCLRDARILIEAALK